MTETPCPSGIAVGWGVCREDSTARRLGIGRPGWISSVEMINISNRDGEIARIGRDTAHDFLEALAEQLAAANATYELVVIGGSALLALGLVERPTSDVDVVALKSGSALVSAEPFPAPLLAARDRVARDFGLPQRWLNPGPTSLLDLGLPDALCNESVRGRIAEV